MSRFSICLVLLALIAFFGLVSAKYRQQFAINQGFLGANQTATVALSSIPLRPSGNFTVTVSTQYTFLVCLQQGFEIIGDLSSCNPNGLFNFSRANNTAQPDSFVFSFDEQSVFDGAFDSAFLGDSATTTSQSTTLLANTRYYMSYGFASPNMPDNSTFSLFVYYDDEGCNTTQIGLPDGTCYNPATIDNTTQKLSAMNFLIYSFEVGKLDNQVFNVTLDLAAQKSPFAHIYSEATASNPNLTLSLRREAVPDGSINDGSVSLTNGTSVTLSLPTPLPGIYYIMVSNNAPVDAYFKLSALSKGCPSGLVGPACNSTFIDLTNNITVIERTGSQNYDYYIVKNQTLVLGVGTKKLKETAPSLLVSLYNFPDNNSAMASSTGNLVNFIHANSLDTLPTYYISVWAEEDTTYYIWANNYCPNNCEGSGSGVNASSNSTVHGKCNINSGVCDCDSGYGGLFCDRSRLATVWIVLLIIGPAIILAIAIGVPVACFLRNRRRAHYERV